MFQAAIVGAKGLLPIGIERLGQTLFCRIVPKDRSEDRQGLYRHFIQPGDGDKEVPFPGGGNANGFSTFAQ